MAKQRINLTVHPKRVLVKITAEEWEELFTINVTTANGKRVSLFKDVEENEGYEKRFRQNVSVGTIISVGTKVKGIMKGDIAILDYTATGEMSYHVGFHNGNRLIAIQADTTWHDRDSSPMFNGRKTFRKGDIDFLSALLGVVRMGRIIAKRPHVFLEWESPYRTEVGPNGTIRISEPAIVKRKVLAAHPDSGYVEGDTVLVNETSLFSRYYHNKEISVIFENDILSRL